MLISASPLRAALALLQRNRDMPLATYPLYERTALCFCKSSAIEFCAGSLPLNQLAAPEGLGCGTFLARHIQLCFDVRDEDGGRSGGDFSCA